MTRRYLLTAVTAAGAIALLVGGALAAIRSTGPTAVTMHASWAQSYRSIPELKANSDVAVTGHIVKPIQQIVDIKGIPYTDFAFLVESVVYDPTHRIVASGTTLRIHQTGGTIDKATFQIDGDPLFATHEHVALFLKEYEPGSFMVIGGPTGRFTIANNVVSSMSDSGVRFSGSISSFADAMKN